MQFHRKRPGGGRLIAVIADLGGRGQRGVLILRIQIGLHKKIADVNSGALHSVTLRKMPLMRHMS